MKIFVLLFSFVTLNWISLAQTPEWVDYNTRSSLYPAREYLVGYAQEAGVKKDALQVSYDYIEQLARAELIESVQVMVNSVSKSETADYNGEISDFFNNETVSSSSANLVGLKSEKYYDKKKKTTHILVYVRRREIISYYESLIQKNISDIRQCLKQGNASLEQQDFQAAFKHIYSTPALFSSIDESQVYLLALGQKSEMSLKSTDVNTLKSEVEAALVTLNQHPEKNLEDVSYFIAVACKGLSIPSADSVAVQAFTYESTGLETKLSYVLKNKLKEDLAAQANYLVAQQAGGASGYAVQGTYWEKGEFLVIKATLYHTNTKTALKSFSTQLAKRQLNANSSYLSEDIRNIASIPHMQFSSANTRLTGQVGFPVNETLKVKVLDAAAGKPMYNVPVRFVDREHQIVYGTAWTDEKGVATYKIRRIKNGARSQVIVGELDLDAFLKVGSKNEYLNKVLKSAAVPSVNFYATIKESLVYFSVNENNLGEKLGVPVIEPALKKYLNEMGYSFTQNMSEASLIIDIQADTRRGGEFSGVFFSYLDVTLSVKEKASMKEVFKKSYSGYKGSGGSFYQAGSKSYEKATQEVCNEFYTVLQNL